MKYPNTRLSLIGIALILVATGSWGYEPGDIIVRAGPALVNPGDDSDPVPGFAGSGLEADDNTQLGLTVSYMLNNHIALELLAATPFSHDVKGNGSLSGLAVGSLKHLPPTLSLIYYPMDSSAKLQPFLGLGVNYTLFFDTKTDQATEDALNGGNHIELDVDDSVGVALRAGFDYQLNNRWSANAGLWYLDIDTTATLKIPGANVNVDMEVDPLVYMIGLNYNF